jgi:hypothetical protein
MNIEEEEKRAPFWEGPWKYPKVPEEEKKIRLKGIVLKCSTIILK